MQTKFGYKMQDILNMTALEFQTFVDSISVGETKQEDAKPKRMTIDQAFPQFFTDPFAKKKGVN